jgi:hypothetical protein
LVVGSAVDGDRVGIFDGAFVAEAPVGDSNIGDGDGAWVRFFDGM